MFRMKSVREMNLLFISQEGMGNDRYILIDLDHEEKRISPAEAVAGVKPFKLIRG